MDAAAPELPGLGGSLALSLISLGVVCAVAYGLLRWLSRKGLGGGTGPVRGLARCPLEPRRSAYLLEVGGRVFLVGAGDGAMSLLAELDAASIREPEMASPRPPAGRFAEVLARGPKS